MLYDTNLFLFSSEIARDKCNAFPPKVCQEPGQSVGELSIIPFYTW